MSDDTFTVDMLHELHAAGATQRHIARILGVSVSAVSRWGSGERHPSGYSLFRLARLHRAIVHGQGAL